MSKSESAGATAVLVAKRSFQDIDELEHLSSLQREIKLTQLSLQRLECDFISVDFGEAHFTFAESSCPVQCIGAKANEYLDFACVLDAHQPGLFSHGYRLSVHTLSGFDAERETRIIVPANQRCFFSYVKRSLVDDCLEAMDRTDIKAAFWRENYVYAPAALPSVQAYLREFLAMVQQQPSFLRQPHTKRLVLEDFIPLLLSAIPSGDKHDLGISAPNRAQLVQQAEDYLLEHLDQLLENNVPALGKQPFAPTRKRFVNGGFSLLEIFSTLGGSSGPHASLKPIQSSKTSSLTRASPL
jgi:hypothetical protein